MRSVKLDLGEMVVILLVNMCLCPQVGCEEVGETFWRQVDQHLEAISERERVIAGSDMNGFVG